MHKPKGLLQKTGQRLQVRCLKSRAGVVPTAHAQALHLTCCPGLHQTVQV
jgi:hypothetical protein